MALARQLLYCLSIAVLTIFGSGCAIHPLPDDISRETTYSIIQKIRCEAQEQVIVEVRELLSRSRSPIVQSLDPKKVVANLVIVGRNDPAIANIIQKYRVAVVGYGFTFTITEENNAGGSADFILPFTHSTFTLGISGHVDKTRKNTRKIEVLDTFEELADLDCSEISKPSRNLLYPITGSIGMGEIIHSFLSLSETLHVKASSTPTAEHRSFIDTLTFTTDINPDDIPGRGIKPSIELKRHPKGRFGVEKASATFLAARLDSHVVIVSLTFPVERQWNPQTGQMTRMSASRKSMTSATEKAVVVDETKKQAAEEICIQRALAREREVGVNRYDAPEFYCRKGLEAD